MTAEAFAELVQAQRTGAGRWKKRCWAHNDRSPSLSIRDGRDGEVSILCRAGCTLDAILAVLRLGKDDILGPPLSRERTAATRAVIKTREQSAITERKARVKELNRIRALRGVVNELEATLAHSPENTAVAQFLHSTRGKLSEAEAYAKQLNPMRRESAQGKEQSIGESE